MVGKAKSKHGFLRRDLRITSRDTKDIAYRCLVRPNLEYCCSAWDPHQNGQICDLEMVQRKAARFVYGEYRNSAEFRSRPTDMSRKLGWESLEVRRKKTKIGLTYKIVHGHVAIPAERHFTMIIRKTRGCAHSFKLLEPSGNIPSYQAASFFYDTPRFWNIIDSTIAEAPSLTCFKSRLSKMELQWPADRPTAQQGRSARP